MSEPTDKKLYNHVKTLANKKFKSPFGIYRYHKCGRKSIKSGGKYTLCRPITQKFYRTC